MGSAFQDYWSYYDENFDWRDTTALVRPDLEATRKGFARIGLSSSEIEEYITSGYVTVGNDVVIDRFYGGPLLSSDMRSRIPFSRFLTARRSASNGTLVLGASSISELMHHLDFFKRRSRGELVYRGQTNSYTLGRARPNPFFEVAGIGEISLVPSLWRVMRGRNPASFLPFQSLILFEWSHILYSGFDLAEIERRQDAINRDGGWIHTAQDMEDSDDPLLQAFGRVRLDLQYGLTYNLADRLATLLQHYGLYSPVLDLTTDPEVALFFSTHRFVRNKDRCTYEFVGTNQQRSVLYVFEQRNSEIREYEHHRVLDYTRPSRPERQSCMICSSDPFCLNLAAEHLVGIIKLDFDLAGPGRFNMYDLFPPRSQDKFLKALKTRLSRKAEVTEFP